MKIDDSGYIIGKIFNQLVLDNLNQKHLIAFFFQNMIPTKTCYKTYDNKLMAIIEVFKT